MAYHGGRVPAVQGSTFLLAATWAAAWVPGLCVTTNPYLKYFSVWDAENGCAGSVSPQPHPGGYVHYKGTTVACPGGCTLSVTVVTSVGACQAACNTSAACAPPLRGPLFG